MPNSTGKIQKICNKILYRTNQTPDKSYKAPTHLMIFARTFQHNDNRGNAKKTQ
jgi:hypothetical protein